MRGTGAAGWRRAPRLVITTAVLVCLAAGCGGAEPTPTPPSTTPTTTPSPTSTTDAASPGSEVPWGIGDDAAALVEGYAAERLADPPAESSASGGGDFSATGAIQRSFATDDDGGRWWLFVVHDETTGVCAGLYVDVDGTASPPEHLRAPTAATGTDGRAYGVAPTVQPVGDGTDCIAGAAAMAWTTDRVLWVTGP
ncbi:MAG TPA: hypothetical protein VES40_19145 [Ilumatobacteraceae bacterium]|nr:hypothetical protein [Ilumatobacteraceae bacterium]